MKDSVACVKMPETSEPMSPTVTPFKEVPNDIDRTAESKPPANPFMPIEKIIMG